MGARTVKFGLTLPQFGASWSEVKEIASLADEVGWDSVWVADHFLGVGSDDPLEAWTEMSAVAAITRRVELGFLVLCNSYRPPALLAKMAATLDAVSYGRLILGYGAGWFAQEYEAYGYDFPPIPRRGEAADRGGPPGDRLPDRRPGALSHGHARRDRLAAARERAAGDIELRHQLRASRRRRESQTLRAGGDPGLPLSRRGEPVLPPLLRSHLAN